MILKNPIRCELEQGFAQGSSGMVKLSQQTQLRVDLLFHSANRPKAAKLLAEQCGNNLPFLEDADEYALERFRFAALKLSGGDLGELRSAIRLAKADWRDLLVAAGFAEDVGAHKRWLPERRANETVE